MQDDFWKYVAYGYLITQTLCISVILEVIILGRPYISLFWLIFAVVLHINLTRHPELPLSRHWPFLRK